MNYSVQNVDESYKHKPQPKKPSPENVHLLDPLINISKTSILIQAIVHLID